jgi:hypothetical protein
MSVLPELVRQRVKMRRRPSLDHCGFSSKRSSVWVTFHVEEPSAAPTQRSSTQASAPQSSCHVR